MSPFLWLLPLLVGLGAGLILTPVARQLALRTRILDLPVGGKIHAHATPLLGGVAVYLAFAAGTVTVLPFSHPVVGVLLGGLTAVGVGILDEKFNLPPLLHLGGQIVAAMVAIVAGVGFISSVSLPWAGLTSPGLSIPAALGFILALFWLVGMMNTVNFLDGLDGLAAGVAALAALLLAVWAAESNRFYVPAMAHHEDLLLPLALVGALLGFLPYNWHVARIFLGDSGSMFLGLAIGALSIVGPAKLGTALLVLLIPVLDVAWAIVRRRMSGRSFLSGDKQHVYHRMLEAGLGPTTTVVLLYGLCFVLAALDLFLFKFEKLVAFLIYAVVIGAGFILLESRAARTQPPSDSDLPRTAGGTGR